MFASHSSGSSTSTISKSHFRIDTAEDFADDEHDKRGSSWGSGGRRTYRENAAGRELGHAMEVLHGLDGAGDKPKALPHR